MKCVTLTQTVIFVNCVCSALISTFPGISRLDLVYCASCIGLVETPGIEFILLDC